MRATKFIPRVLFGQGSFEQLFAFVDGVPGVSENGYLVYVIDAVHNETGLRDRLLISDEDVVVEVDVSAHEPKTADVDRIRDDIHAQKGESLPRVIVGIGGGSILDIAKAVSVMLTNPGSSADYQGWDLVKSPAVPKIAVPTLSGTGAEATRTAVLTGPVKKLGINSDQSMFDAVLMDPDLLRTVPNEQEFYTGMDCFIHCAESLSGSAINALGRPFALQAGQAVEDFFLKEKDYEKLMVGSFLGGCSVANSSVGICHALSYGVSFILGYRHGLANCIVFNQLAEFYPDEVAVFQKMVGQSGITLPSNATKDVNEEQMDKMIALTYMLEKDLISALGDGYKDILTPRKIIELYGNM